MFARLSLPLLSVVFFFFWHSSAFAHGENITESFPITGAYSASQIEVRDRVPVIQFSGNYDKQLAEGQPNYEARATVAKEFFRNQPDNYDFLVTFTTFEFQTGDALAFYLGVRNDTQGIGLPLFDNSKLFGSNGKLQGYIDMAALSRYQLDPTHPAFEQVLDTLAHEVWHRWGAFVHIQDEAGERSDVLLGKDGAHWSYLLDTSGSVGYGARWRDNGDGSFSAVSTRKFYSPLDLYLMGFYSEADVPSFSLIENPDVDPLGIPRDNDKIDGTLKQLTLADVIAAEGPRIPDAAAAPKEFRLAFALVTAPGEKPSQSQINAINAVRDGFQTRFSILTGGRGVTHVYPEAKPVEFVGSPETLPTDATPSEALDLDQGIAWLRSRQAEAGHWTDKETTRLRDTVVVLEVLRKQDAGFQGMPLALQWLDARQESNTDYLARRARLSSFINGNATAISAQLLALQNSDGGWGVAKGFHSSPMDTALVLDALSRVGSSSPQALQKGLQYLLAARNADGGWGSGQGGESRVSATTLAIRALVAAGEGDAIRPALDWLATRQQADGGFGDGASTVHDTASTFEAFIDANATDVIRAQASANYLLSAQRADGSWNGSVYATALALSALKRFNFHNWAVRSFVAVPESPRDGERVKLSIVIENDSNRASPQARLRLYESDGAGGEQAVGSDINIPIMAARSALTFSPLWDSMDKAGQRTLKVVVDPDIEHVEMSRADNMAVRQLEVQPADEGIDLAVEGPDVLVSPARPDELPVQLAVSASIRNLGKADAQDVEVVLRDAAAVGEVIDRITLSIPGRSSGAVNFIYPLQRAGSSALIVEIDPTAQVEDIDRTNNSATVPLETSPSVDLEVLTSDLSLSAPQVYVGDEVTLSAVLRNRGTLEVPAATVRYSLNDSNGVQELRLNTVSIPAGSTLVQQLVWRADRSGELGFLVEVDPEGVLPEKNESNNTASATFNSVLADGPNLSVNFRDFSVTPEALLERGDAQLSVKVVNSGTQAAQNVAVQFFLGNPASGGQQLGETQVIAEIAAGASAHAGLSWTDIPEPGEQLLYVLLDPENSIADPNIQDNITFARVQVASLPDLAVGQGDLRLLPTNPKAGETVNLVASISNLGQQPAQNVRVRAYDGTVESGVLLDTEQVIPLLSPSSSETLTFSWVLDSKHGSRTVTLVVDPESQVEERHKANNAASRDFILQNRDFYVTERYFSPDGDGSKDSTEFAFRLNEPTDIDILVLDARDRERHKFSGEQLQASTGGRQVWGGLDRLGRLLPDGSYRFRVVKRSTGDVLGEAPVDIDTNRSSLFKALDTPYELYRNLSCELPAVDELQFGSDEDTAFFRIKSDSSDPDEPYSSGVYRINASGAEMRLLFPSGHFPPAAYPTELIVSPDGSRVMFKLYDQSRKYSTELETFWAMDAVGKNLQQIKLPAKTRLLGANINGNRFYGVQDQWNNNPQILAINTLDATVASLYRGDSPINYIQVADGGRRLAFDSRTGGGAVVVLDTEIGQFRKFPTGSSGSDMPFALSPDEKKIAIYDADTRAVNVFDTGGRPMGLFRLPETLEPEEVKDITWSADSTEFAFYVRGVSDDGGGYGEGYGDDPGQDRDGGGLFVATLGETELHRALKFDSAGGPPQLPQMMVAAQQKSMANGRAISEYGISLLWAPGDRTLLYRHENGAHVVFLEEDDRVAEVFGDWYQDLNDLGFIKSGRKLIIGRDESNNTPCRPGQKAWTYQSLLNLTADFRAIRSVAAGGIVLRGTASDLNFESYQLEYANQNSPDLWRPVAPAQTDDAVDEVLTTWAPPEPGRYRVRLTVTDKAGNRRQAVRTTSWSQQLSITDLYREPAFISPNGDGVQDEALLGYRVLQPVQVEMNVIDVSGKTVRSISRQHLEMGTFSLPWDGRDNIGRVVPDGLYRMLINQFEFFVTVDKTNPRLDVRLWDAYSASVVENAESEACKNYVAVRPELGFGKALNFIRCKDSLSFPEPVIRTKDIDANFLDLTIEQGGVQAGQWQEVYALSGLPELESYKLSDLQRLAGSQFRVVATDKAGNRSVVITNQAKEELIVHGVGELALKLPLRSFLSKKGVLPGSAWPNVDTIEELRGLARELRGYWQDAQAVPYVPMDALESVASKEFLISERYGKFQIAETVVDNFAALHIQFRKNPDDAWQEAPVAGILNAEGDAAVQYYLDQTPPLLPQYMNGYSTLLVDLSPLQTGQRYDVRLVGMDLAGTLHYSNLFSLRVNLSLAFRGIPEGVEDWASVRQAMTKPLESGEWMLWGTETLASKVVRAELYLTSATDSRYALRRLAATAHYPDEVILFPTKNLSSCHRYIGEMVLYGQSASGSAEVELGRTTKSFDVPCLGLEGEAKPVYAQACDVAPPGKTIVKLNGSSLDGRKLKLLTLEYDGDVVFNVNEPVPGVNYNHEVDTSGLEEGVYAYTARLINVDDRETTASIEVIVDRTPPAALISYPQEGQKLCGVPRVISEVERSVVDIEGEISDDNPAEYSLNVVSATTGELVKALIPIPSDPPVLWQRFGQTLHGRLNTESHPLFGVTGALQAQLKVRDLGGHLVCTAVDFEFDGQAEVSVLTLNHKVFAPTGNGLFDELVIGYELLEPGLKSLSIHRQVYDEVNKEMLVGERVRSLYDEEQSESGLYTEVWDGLDDSGTKVADGKYVIQLLFKDGCGNQVQRLDYVTVDTTPPTLAIGYPKASDPLTMLVEVTGSVQDLHMGQYRLEVNGENLLELAKGTANRQNALLGYWNTTGLSGEHELRLFAVDRVGNEAELIVPLLLTERVDLLSYLEATPRLFSPNNDGRLDSTSLRLGLAERVTLTVRVLKDQAVVRTLVNGQVHPVGALTLPWDGRNDQGELQPDGEYGIEVNVALADNPAVQQTEAVSVIIDTQAPKLLVSKPVDGITRSAGNITGAVTDLHMEEYVIELASGGADWVELVTGIESAPQGVLAEFPVLEEGDHTLRLRARDQAANQSEFQVKLLIDNEAPVVEILTPDEGSVVGAAAGELVITGRVEEKNPRRYALEIGTGQAPSDWRLLVEGDAQASASMSAPFNPLEYADGIYTLRLHAEDLADNRGEVRSQLTVDKTPPVALLSLPAAGAYVTGPVEITGTATDLNLLEYRLGITPGASTENALWSELGMGDSSVDRTALLAWDALPPDGAYTLRLEVKDAAGNQNQAYQSVIVDTRPPAAPTGLSAKVNQERVADLNWQANTEPDLAGYHLYRDGIRLSADLLPAPVAVDSGLDDGRYIYTLTATDHAGLESEHSEPFELPVDFTPPATALFSPAADSLVHGLVEIKGTAFSYDDFKEYRLFVGAGADPQDWQLIRRSPVAILADVLGLWDTLGLPEGAVYSLRLEAEDINGNIGTQQVIVTVDNLAPATPQGLAADVVSADAALSWNPNSEDDLLGYLLFRDGRLVNVEGALVGEMRPYALLDTAYPDRQLPDGKHLYSIAAIDLAGNMSELSEEVEITIDVRAPQAVIVQPLDGHAFDEKVFVNSISEDTDIASVQFQYRVDGTNWLDAGVLDAAEPWESVFVPADHGLSYGMIELRALATDHGGKVDPDPLWITLDYRDVTAPDQLLALAGQVDGGRVTLGWTPSDAPDLAGYHIQRQSEGADPQRLTDTPVANPEYVDSDLDDGVYLYSVIAVDETGNESDPTEPYQATVYTPTAVQPRTPQLGRTQTLTGAGLQQLATVSVTRESIGGPVQLTGGETDPLGGFVLADLPLESGLNQVTLVLVDHDGNRSKPVQIVLMTADAPAAPTDLVAESLSALEVRLGWSANQETDIAGYRPYRDAKPLLSSAPILPNLVVASSTGSSSSPSAVLSDSGYWRPSGDASGEWIEVRFNKAQWVDSMRLRWWASYYGPRAYVIEAWSSAANIWTTVARVTDNVSQLNALTLEQPYYSDRFRIRVEPANYYQSVRLQRFELTAIPLVADLSHTDRYGAGEQSNGSFAYSLAAVNTQGFEGTPSEPAQISIGDAVVPAAVTLSAQVAGSDAELSWTESPNAHGYELLRNGERIAELNAGTINYVDTDLANGDYRYVVIARRYERVRSEPSNEVAVSIDKQLPATPLALAVQAPEAGSSLQLSWTPGEGSTPVTGYQVQRSLVSGGPYKVLGITGSTDWLDQPLENGLRYFYVVQALDAAGNRSGLSNQADGMAQRLLIGTPAISYPTRSGATHFTQQSLATVAGLAEPGSRVSLLQNGRRLRTVDAGWQTESLSVSRNHGYHIYGFNSPLSPDGRYLALFDGDGLIIHDFHTGEKRERLSVQGEQYLTAAWLNQREVLIVDLGDNGLRQLRSFNVDDDSSRLLSTLNGTIDALEVSPDKRRVAVLARKDGVNGVWILDLETGTWTKVHDTSYLGDIQYLSWAPDSRLLAFADYSAQPSRLEIIDVLTASKRSLQPSRLGGAFAWLNDSTGLVYQASDANWRSHLFSYSLDTGQSRQLTNGLSHSSPVVLPDGRLLANVGGRRLSVIDESGQETETLYTSDYWLEHVEYVEGGYLLAADYNRSWRLALAGRFEVPGVVLDAGDNVFSAIARNQAEVDSQPASPVLINYSTEGLADLAILAEDVTLLPGVPRTGEPARISLRIRNLGKETADATVINLSLVSPAGTAQHLMLNRAFAALPPGQTRSITVDWSVPAQSGVYTLAAVIDPYDVLSETTKTNNVLLRDVTAVEEAAPVLSGSLDAAVYGVDQDVRITSTVLNPGAAFTGTLEVSVLDDQGYSVATLGRRPVTGLGYGQKQTESSVWKTTGVFAGGYSVMTRLYDQNEVLVAEYPMAFTLAAAGELSAHLAADRASYSGNQPVNLVGGYQYLLANTPIADAQLYFSVFSDSGELLAEKRQELGTLLPDATGESTMLWNTGQSPAGDYRARIEVLKDGVSLAHAETWFVIGASSVQLQGSLTQAYESVAAGVAHPVVYRVGNIGNKDGRGLELQVQLYDPEARSIVETHRQVIDLPRGASTEGQVSFDTAALGLKSYRVLLHVINAQAQLDETLASTSFQVTDITPPRVEIRQPAIGSYLRGPIQGVALAIDDRSRVGSVDVRVNGGDWVPTDIYDPGESLYRSGVLDLVDGEYRIEARAGDASGNIAVSPGVRFVVDNSAPAVVITGVEEGAFYPGTVIPQITVTDVNLEQSRITLNGEAFVSGTPVEVEGSYRLVVFARDKAGNETERSLSFALLLSEPQIQITGVEEAGVYNQGVTPVITVTDGQLSDSLLNGQPFVSGTQITLEGGHELLVRAVNAAGTKAERILGFTLDLTAPMISIEGVEEDVVYPGSVTPQVSVTDLNLEQSLITLNGEAFVSGTPVEAEGRYQLRVYGRDKAGNETERSLWFSVLLGEPQIEITGVDDGGLYNRQVVPVITISGAQSSEILLNGQPFASGTAVTLEGAYTLKVLAENAVGRTAERELSFALDLTAPEVIFISPQQGAEIQQASVAILGETSPGAEVTLSRDGFQQQAVADASGVFRLADVPLVIGANQFSAFARDPAGNLGAPSLLTLVRLSDETVELDGQLSQAGRVLLWVPGAFAGGGVPGRQQVLLDLLRDTLERDKLDYHIVHEEVSLRLALRSGRYNTVVLGELHKAGTIGNHLLLSHDMLLELQASVAAGVGLVWIKTHPDNNEHWEKLFGAKPNGAAPKMRRVTLTDSPASSQGDWGHQGFAMRLKLTAGLPVGGFTPAGSAAMVLHGYGAGPTLLMAFEPNNLSDRQAGMAIVSNALRYAATGSLPLQAGGVADVTWQVSGMKGEGLSLESKLLGPSFLHAWDAVIEDPATARWDIPADQEQLQARALLRLPLEPGGYSAKARVLQREGLTTRTVAEHELTLSLAPSDDVLIADLMEAVLALPVISHKDRLKRELVVSSINLAAAIAPVDVIGLEAAMAHLRMALNLLEGISVEKQTARVRLGYVMRGYQLKWSAKYLGNK